MKKNICKKLTVLIAVPLAFSVLGYMILFFSTKSLTQPIVSIWELMSANSNIGDAASKYSDIYSEKLFNQYTDTIPSSVITFPTFGTKYGEISIENTALNCNLIFGDNEICLRNGAGHYPGSSFPGFGSTILIGGHNNRYFDTLKDATVGSIITVKTNYGIYTYRITGTAIKPHGDPSAFNINAEHENIVLYTCYPFNMLGLTNQRYFVYGEYVSGAKVLLHE